MVNSWQHIIKRGATGDWYADYELCGLKRFRQSPPPNPTLDPTKYYGAVVARYDERIQFYDGGAIGFSVNYANKGSFRYPSNSTGKTVDYLYSTTNILNDITDVGAGMFTFVEGNLSATCCNTNSNNVTSNAGGATITVVVGTKSVMENTVFPSVRTVSSEGRFGTGIFTGYEYLYSSYYILHIQELINNPFRLGNDLTPDYNPAPKTVRWSCNTYNLNDTNPQSFWRDNGGLRVNNQFNQIRTVPTCPPPEPIDTPPYICSFSPFFESTECPEDTLECIDADGRKCCIDCCEIGAYVNNQIRAMWL